MVKIFNRDWYFYQQSFVKALHHSARGENIYFG